MSTGWHSWSRSGTGAAHYDHTGGLPALLERTRPGLPFYAHPDLFRERFAQRREQPEFIGLPLAREVVAARAALRLIAEPQQILPGVWTTGEIALRRNPWEAAPTTWYGKGKAGSPTRTRTTWRWSSREPQG